MLFSYELKPYLLIFLKILIIQSLEIILVLLYCYCLKRMQCTTGGETPPILLTLFRIGRFGAAHGWERAHKGSPSLKSVTYILHDETWHSYSLPKKDPKNI